MTQWYNCAICGKRKPAGSGWFYTFDFLQSLGVPFEAIYDSRMIYACNRCVDPLERAMRNRKEEESVAPFLAIAREWKEERAKREQATREKERQIVEELLAAHASEEWIILANFTKAFRERGFDVNGHQTAQILRNRGFLVRRRTHGWSYVHGKKI